MESLPDNYFVRVCHFHEVIPHTYKLNFGMAAFLPSHNPVTHLVQVVSSFSTNACDAAVHKDEKWSMAKHQEEEHDPLAALPAIPPKQTYEAPDEQPYNAESRLPAVDSKMTAALSNASERERLQSSVKAASV